MEPNFPRSSHHDSVPSSPLLTVFPHVFVIFSCYIVGVFGFGMILAVPIVLILIMSWEHHYSIFYWTTELRTEYDIIRKSAIEKGESINWLNTVVDRWWSCNKGTVTNFVKDWVEPIVEQFKFPFIVAFMQILSFDSGPNRIKFNNIRLLKRVSKSRNKPVEDDINVFIPMTYNRLTKPPIFMMAEGMTSFAFEADADLEVPSVEDFKIKARIGKTSGLFQDMILNVESFHIAGKIRCVFEADKKAEFPHLTVGDVCFVENPLVDVQCRILRDKVNVSQLPVAKQIMEKYIAIGFKQLLVFPGKQHIDFTPTPLPGPEWEGLRGCGLSQGVLTVRIECENIELVKKTLMSNYYCKLKFGSQKCLRECTNGDISSWTSTFSFLVHDPSEELLNVKLMGRRKMFQNTCVAKQKINLLTLGIIHKEQNVSKKSQVRLSTDDGSIQLLLSLYYSPLPEFSLLNHQHHTSSIIHDNSTQDAGVLYIHIHSAVNLINRSSKSYDPYCIVKWGDKDVFQTHVVNNTRNPVWEKGIEILVPSCHNVPLSFNVYSNRTLASHDHLGVTFLTLHTDFTHLLQHRLYLDGTRHAFSPTSPAIFVSMVFRNVESVRWSWESQQEAFIQRSRRQSSSAHLNTSGKFLNPVSNGRILLQMSDSLEESYIDDESSDD